MIAAIAKQQLVSMRRQRLAQAAIGVLVAVTAMAGLLGWASHHTIVGVYDEATKLLAARGQAAPPNPFLVTPSLSMLSNLVIYVTMIGALVALLVGHVAVADDEAGGVGRLVFSRRVPRRAYVLGKLAGVAVVLAAAMVASTLVSIVALTVVNGSPPAASDDGRLVAFALLSWLYLMIFATVGSVTLLAARRRSLGLLSAIGVWLVVTFAMPQFTSGLRPTQSLNPIVDPVSTSQRFFRLTATARPLSIAEGFKAAAAGVLGTGAPQRTVRTVERIVPLVAALALLGIAMFVLVARHDYSRSNPDA